MANIIDIMIGRQILLRRLEMEMTAGDLAAHLELAPLALDALEAGQQRVTNEILKKLAKILGVPLSYFFDWDRPPEQHEMPADSSAPVPSPEAYLQKP